MAEFRNAPEIRQSEPLSPKGVLAEWKDMKETSGVQAALTFINSNFGSFPEEDKKDMKLLESVGFLRANGGAAELFARVVKHCESSGTKTVGELVTECQDGLPTSVSDVSKLAEKFKIAEATAGAEAKTTVAEATGVEKQAMTETEKQTVSRLIKEFGERRSDLSQKFGERLKAWESETLSDGERKNLGREILTELKTSLESARASGKDTTKAEEDLRFFAEKFRSLGIINHTEFRELFEKGTEKSGEGEKKPFAGRTELALAEGFRKADSHPPTFVSFDRKDEKGRVFDEILKIGADGKSGTKEIVSPQSGYSLEVPLTETREEALAEKESAVGTIQEKTQRVEGRAKWVEKTFGAIPKDGEFPKEALHALKELATAAKLPPVDEKNPRETLAKVKETLKSEYEASKNELASARAALAKTAAELAEAKARQGKDGLKSEENAREIIAFLDETGITAFGRTNTELLLKKFQSDAAAAGAKISLQNGNPDVREGFSETAKTALRRAFVRQVEETLGKNVFSDTEPKKLLAGVNLTHEFATAGRYDHASGKVDWEKSSKIL